MARSEAIAKEERALHEQYDPLVRGKLVAVLSMVAITQFISFMDQNGLATALPTVAEDLNAQSTISWAGTSSLLANTTFQMLYGRLSDIFGRKTMFLGAVGLLSFADLLCGLSRNPTMLYISRGLAGIGGGGITNLSMIIVSDVVTLEQRGKYIGITGSMIGAGSVVGPFVAAAFAEKSTWRGFFWLISPLAAIITALCACFLPSKPPEVSLGESIRKIDYLGTLTSSIGIIFILIPISGGGAYFDWDSPMVIAMLAIGATSLVLFVLVQWKIAKLPMMPVDVYRSPMISVLMMQSFLLGVVYQSNVYYVPLYLQNAHRFSPIISAVLIVPMLAMQSVMSAVTGYFISHYKRYAIVIQFGFGMWTLGSGLALVFTRSTNPGVIVVVLLCNGIGVGCVFQPTLVALQSHSTKSRRAVIISSRNFWRCAGGAVGLSVSAAVLQARLRSALPPEYQYLAKSTYALPSSGHVPDAVLDAYMQASRAVFILLIPIIGVCFLLSMYLKDRALEPLDDDHDRRNNNNGVVDGDTTHNEQQHSMPRIASVDADADASGTNRS